MRLTSPFGTLRQGRHITVPYKANNKKFWRVLRKDLVLSKGWAKSGLQTTIY
ncbi:MAG: hypothetical protein CM15mP106_6080 [Candidatus Neomarinimicrobiota bacterium]|nr:MAG: hypothetical protein CM15mP106_6080 [Candidatus Neomarinimicrobiota bacterium]